MDSYEEYARRAKLMAKVHGRPFSYDIKDSMTTAKENKHSNGTSSKSKQMNTPESTNVLKQNNSTGSNSSSSASISKANPNKQLKKTKSMDKKNKKKSLRRL